MSFPVDCPEVPIWEVAPLSHSADSGRMTGHPEVILRIERERLRRGLGLRRWPEVSF
jgi:hypothetical protein